jgi:serine/threonine protein phosphatase PrpC
MNYAVDYHVGKQRAGSKVNEDSVAVTVVEDGHREGLERTANGDEDAPSPGAGVDGDPRALRLPDDPDAGRAMSTPTRSAGVFVLADGAGGHQGGDVASYIATMDVVGALTETVHRILRNRPEEFGVDLGPAADAVPGDDDVDVETAIAGAIRAADRRILQYARETGNTTATTVVAGIHIDGRFHYGWAGDSRAYVVNRARDRIDPLTTDHSEVQRRFEADELDEVEAMVHPSGKIVECCGGGPYTEEDDIDVATDTVDLFAEDVVLLTSDGLLDARTDRGDLLEMYRRSDRSPEMAETIRERMITDDDLRRVIRETDTLSAAARRYVGLANEHGGSDNVSVVLYEDPSAAPTPEDGLPEQRPRPSLRDAETIVKDVSGLSGADGADTTATPTPHAGETDAGDTSPSEDDPGDDIDPAPTSGGGQDPTPADNEDVKTEGDAKSPRDASRGPGR